MSRDSIVEELVYLTTLDAPSGFEEPVQSFCQESFRHLCDRVEFDRRGNVYGHNEPGRADAPKVLVMTHADEIGLQVTHVRPDGFIGFTKIGGVTESVLPGSRVHLLTNKGKVEALVGVRPGHVLDASQMRAVPEVRAMYLDVGFDSKPEVEALGIEPGVPGVLAGPLIRCGDSARVFGKAIDNRAGILAQLKLAEHCRDYRPACAMTFAVTVEEEIGLRGALLAAQRIEPDIVLAIDTVPAGGPPDVAEADLPWKIGQGPIIKVRETKGFVSHRPLRERVLALAREHGIPHQLIVDTAGITDASAAQQASGNIAALTLGLPRRYAHSAVEMLDLNDLENLVKLLCLTIPALADPNVLDRFR